MLQVKGKAEGMEYKRADTKRVSGNMTVQFAFGVRTQRFIDEAQSDSTYKNDGRTRGDDPSPYSARRLLRG
ncbi:MAG: hypothetical protein NTNFB01_08200 [Nitrospira sp.]